MYRELNYIPIKVKVDWREPCTQLKIKYPVNFNFRKPTYEIPYGYIEKSANGGNKGAVELLEKYKSSNL